MSTCQAFSQKYQFATFGMGCFWCSEAIFKDLHGVVSVKPGYSGGNVSNPTYRQVCEGNTGHAEVVQIQFDPEQITFTQLLEVFFQLHDPTTVDQQGVDVGTQYRSIIFAHSDEQMRIAREVIERIDMERIWPTPIVTKVEKFEKFWEAEDYHHDYFANNQKQGYCRMVIKPKIDKLHKVFSRFIK